MIKSQAFASLLVEEAKAKIRAGESRTDFDALETLTDADVLRQAADDPEERDWNWARAIVIQGLAEPGADGLKVLLASAPLGGIDLDRNPAFGRDLEI